MSTLSPITRRSSTYERLAELPLVVESYRLEGLARPWSADFVRRTTVVHLRGGGHVGVGEDVTYTPDDHEHLQRAGAVLPLAGTYTLRSFSALLDALELFPMAPRRRDSREHRRWAFESAALDLALRQAGVSLAEALGRDARPVRFVVSMHLGEPPSVDPVLARLALYPDLRFKLDATSGWDEGLIDRLAATGAVEIVDFKGHYDGLPVDGAADPDLYRRVAERLPDAWLEDPALTPHTRSALAPSMSRITWDAPIRSAVGVATLAVRPPMINVKPSRFGTLRALLDAYDSLAARGIGAYGGGQFELGPGRGQIQYLASLFHPDAPNDVAPTGFHEIQPGLPTSPLDVDIAATGFSWGSTCCPPAERASCCEPAAKAECCAPTRTGGCGCR